MEIGAGTVLTANQVRECEQAGARIIVAPDTDAEVISTALGMGLTPYPGAATPTEAFAAIKAGATKVKLFPSSAVGISGMKAWSEVLPAGTELFPVGGVGADNAAEWRNAGAAGLGSVRRSIAEATAPTTYAGGRGDRLGVGSVLLTPTTTDYTKRKARTMKITSMTTFIVPPRWLFLKIESR